MGSRRAIFSAMLTDRAAPSNSGRYHRAGLDSVEGLVTESLIDLLRQHPVEARARHVEASREEQPLLTLQDALDNGYFFSIRILKNRASAGLP